MFHCTAENRNDRCVFQLQDRRQGFPGQLCVRLLQVVQVQVGIAQGVHELARRKAGDLGHHQGEQGIGGDVEGFSDIQVFSQIASGNFRV